MTTARNSLRTDAADAERMRQDSHLQEGVDCGALDLSARRVSLDAGQGLTGDHVLAKVPRSQEGGLSATVSGAELSRGNVDSIPSGMSHSEMPNRSASRMTGR